MVYQVNHNHVLWYMFKTTIRWMLGKVLCIIMVKSKIKKLLAQVNAKQSCRQKKRQCWILMYWEIIITYLWFLKSTVGNNTSIKKILASIKYWPQQQRGQQKFADLMPTLFLMRSVTLCRPIIFLIWRVVEVAFILTKIDFIY